MCIVYLADKYGISLADISTGDYFVTEVDTERKLIDEINKFSPSEIICNESFYMSGVDLSDMKNRLGIAVYSLEAWYFSDETAENTLKEHFKVQNLEGLGLSDYACGTIAAGHCSAICMKHRKMILAIFLRFIHTQPGNI